MSVVTGVMLICRSYEDDQIALVQKWLARDTDGDSPDRLQNVAGQAGGGKHPQFKAWCGGFNYFDDEGFAAFVMGLNWESPENVVLTMQPEDGHTRVFRPTERASSRQPFKAPEAIIGERFDYHHQRVIAAFEQWANGQAGLTEWGWQTN